MLLAKAKAGEIAAVKELLQRVLGPPVELDLLQRTEDLEGRLAEVTGKEAGGAMTKQRLARLE